jgi:osmotically-inducible protein OsmY
MNRILARVLQSALLAATLAGCVAAVVPALFVTSVGGAAYVVNDRRAPDTMIADQRIQKTSTSRIQDELKTDVRVDAISYNRQLLLLGEARTDEIKERAGRIAAGVEGVRQVYNEISVTDKLGFRAVASDASLSTQVKARMVGDTATNPLNIHVTTQEGVVYLMGLVTHKEADAASRIAASTGGVKRVVRMFEYIPDNAADAKVESTSQSTATPQAAR